MCSPAGFLHADFAASTFGAIFSPHRGGFGFHLPTGYSLMSAGVFPADSAGRTCPGHPWPPFALAAFVLSASASGFP